MITYTIKYDNCSDLYFMNGVPARFIGHHLNTIATENEISSFALSEGHLLSIIQNEGIEVNLLDSDGSKLQY